MGIDLSIPRLMSGAAGPAVGGVLDLLFVGSWERLMPVARRFHAAGHKVMLVEEAERVGDRQELRRFHLVIAEVEDAAAIAAVAEMVQTLGCPWLALDAGGLITEAFEAGAVSVLSAEAHPDLVESAVRSLTARLGRGEGSQERVASSGRRRRYRAGDPILWSQGQVVVVEKGVLAWTVLHADGTEVLLGFVAAGGLVVAPREDLFAPTVFACSEVEVTVLRWEEALRLPRFTERLRDQLTWVQAWSAAQARPHLDDRLTEILELLARQFGRPHPEGVLVDLRVTHAQLAQAVGSTRSTVTRLLARLRSAGWLLVNEDSGGERWVVREVS